MCGRTAAGEKGRVGGRGAGEGAWEATGSGHQLHYVVVLFLLFVVAHIGLADGTEDVGGTAGIA